MPFGLRYEMRLVSVVSGRQKCKTSWRIIHIDNMCTKLYIYMYIYICACMLCNVIRIIMHFFSIKLFKKKKRTLLQDNTTISSDVSCLLYLFRCTIGYINSMVVCSFVILHLHFMLCQP